MDFFIGEESYTPYWYGHINSDFFTAVDNKVYLHDILPYLTFYGELSPAIVSVYVNGKLSEEYDYSKISKLFLSLNIESQNTPFSKLTYQTKYQFSEHIGDFQDNFQTADFWRNPEWADHKWELPINIQSSSLQDEFNVESNMREMAKGNHRIS